MKKLLIPLVAIMFVLAACEPTDLTALGNSVGAMAESIIEPTTESDDSSSDDSYDDSSSSEPSSASEMEDSSSSESSDSYAVEVRFEDGTALPEELVLHEGSQISWTNTDSVTYSITIVKMDDSSDDSLDNSPDRSSSDDSMDDSYYNIELTVEPGQTVTYIVPDSGMYQFSISGGMISLNGTIYVSDSESEDAYDDHMDDLYDDESDDRYDDAYDDVYDDSSDDSYDDSSDDSYNDDSYDDSNDDDSEDEYEDSEGYEDEEDEEDSHSYLFTIAS